MNVRTPTQLTMDSPSSRAGNSSCDSGCYAGGGEGSKSSRRRVGGPQHGLDRSSPAVYQSPKPQRHPCQSCGKPKQRRNPGSAHVSPSGSHYTSGHHHSSHSPYAPGHYPQAHPGTKIILSPTHVGHYAHGHQPHVHSVPASPHHFHMSSSRTLTDMSGSGDNDSSVKPQYKGGKHGTSRNSASDNSKGPITSVERASLTEEDQEIISITYGKGKDKKPTTTVNPLPASSSQMSIGRSVGVYSPYAPASSCSQCDTHSSSYDSSSCPQCAVYAQCPQCVQYQRYVNTTMRSDSKSSKMSCSSTCTQTTCLSPDHEEANVATANIIDYDPFKSPPSESNYEHVNYQGQVVGSKGSHEFDYEPIATQDPVSKSQPSQPQLQAIMCSPNLSVLQHSTVKSLAVTQPNSTLSQSTPKSTSDLNPNSKPSTISTQSPMVSAKSPTLTLSLPPLTSTSASGTPAISFPGDPVPTGSDAATSWLTESNDSPGMATLYSRGKGHIKAKGQTVGEGDDKGKSPTRSLMPLVSTKLNAERIDLSQMPYSNTVSTSYTHAQFMYNL